MTTSSFRLAGVRPQGAGGPRGGQFVPHAAAPAWQPGCRLLLSKLRGLRVRGL
eukprot:CAMPEP_0206012588 /NCGR_PEP_ID=MMETSP1464-20131121/15095_1 /ASSEMBLY_ACC=CAM_ASM_001124 /TAXON_ID=119497 /ORGANISM="Exanthemachrysis gayraliae, Strain RCC1523" /LENGTH=52 /DNA_ID=CAMNT_0053386275 /DNA_START=26 /DNA_END=180 /DNA_ORIENTATION=-